MKSLKLNNKLISLGGLSISVLFILGLMFLFLQRFESGDTFPAYSSYRTDPLGCTIIYESLMGMDDLTVERNIKALHKQNFSKSTTLFLLGLGQRALSRFDLELNTTLNQFVMTGGRLVVTLYPQTLSLDEVMMKKERQQSNKTEEPHPIDNSAESENQLDKSDSEKYEEGAGAVVFTDLGLRFPSWDVTIDYPDHQDTDTRWPRTATGQFRQHHVTVPWFSHQIFTDLGEGWKPILSIDDHPVMIQKGLGKGVVVIATDSYFMSNEAMWKDRTPTLLNWLVGSNAHVVFNETHHWITEKLGVAGLARKYDLEGAVIGFLALALLFLWKNTSPLLEPYSGTLQKHHNIVASDHDHFSGLVTIIQRSVNGRDLIASCVEEWKKSYVAVHRDDTVTIKQVHDILKEQENKTISQENIVQKYNRITRVIGENAIHEPIKS